MADTTFTDYSTVVPAAWLNDVNDAVYHAVDMVLAGADPTGVVDCTSILVAAIAQAKTVGSKAVYFPRGKYLINTGNISLDDVTLIGTDVQEASTPYTDNGSVILLTNTSTSPFVLGRKVSIKGLSFFWPNQTDANPTPTSYPPLFTGTYVTQFRFQNNTVVNSYQFMKITTGGVGVGDNIVSDNRIYAIDRCFWFLNGAPESFWITGNLFSWAPYEDVVNAGPNYYLRTYTATSGEFFRIDISGGSYTSVDGLFLSDNLVFGPRYGIRLMSGTLNLSNIHDNKFDACSTALSVEGTATIVNTKVSGNTYYSYNISSTTTEHNTVSFTSTGGTSDVTFIGNNFAYTRGSHLFWNSLFADDVLITGNRFANWGQSTQASVTSYYGVGITDAGIRGLISGNSFIGGSGSVAHQRVGVILAGALDILVSNNLFNTCYIGVWLTSTLSNRCIVQGNYSSNTQGSQSFRDDVTSAGVVEAIWNTWDLNPSLNAFPSFQATVSAGQTISTGTKTKLNFASEVFDGDANYDTTTSTFTAPVKGLYAFNLVVTNDAGVTAGEIWKFTIDSAGGATQSKGIGVCVSDNAIGGAAISLPVLLSLSAADTVTANIQRVSGAGSYVVINDTSTVSFSGHRVQ